MRESPLPNLSSSPTLRKTGAEVSPPYTLFVCVHVHVYVFIHEHNDCVVNYWIKSRRNSGESGMAQKQE